MKIMIAVPCMDTVPVDFVKSLMQMTKPEGTSVCFKQNSLIYDSRNILSLSAMENDFDYVLWMDSDMVIPIDTLQLLLFDLENLGEHMISGLYVKRGPGNHPVIHASIAPPIHENGHLVKQIREYTDYPTAAVFPIEGCGFGCCLTSVPLIREVWDRFGPAFAPLPWCGEDIAFCYRVQQLGKPIYCDSRIRCGHIGQFTYIPQQYGGGEE